MDNISKSIAQLTHILERHNYPKDRKFHEELKKYWMKKPETINLANYV